MITDIGRIAERWLGHRTVQAVASRRPRVFVSSPFNDKPGKPWTLREALRDRLLERGYDPWLWERANDAERRGAGVPDLLSQAIASSDVVVVIYKAHAGSYMASLPFRGTEFELVSARALGKPCLFYLVGRDRRVTLSGFLCIVNVVFGAMDPLRTWTESDVAEVVVSDVAAVCGSTPLPESEAQWHLLPSGGVHLDRSWVDRVYQAVVVNEPTGLLDRGRLASMVLLARPSRDLPRDTREQVATVLASMGNTFANLTLYEQAIAATAASVDTYAQLGDWQRMLAQIQALSGILNMSGRVPEALSLNRYGSAAAGRSYPTLLNSYSDSAASILRSVGQTPGALKKARRAAELMPTAYPVAKYADVLSLTGSHGIARAERLVHDVALPLAIKGRESLGYTLREAARVAMRRRGWADAREFLMRAEVECLREGTLHTLSDVRRMALSIPAED